MTTFILLLGSLVFLSAGFFIFALWSYIVARKAPKSVNASESAPSESEKGQAQSNPHKKHTAILALLEQQQAIVNEMRRQCAEKEGLRLALLDCWSLFLTLEAQLINQEVTPQEVEQQLEAFIPLTQEQGFTQMMDALIKKIADQRNLSQAINKDIERKNQLLQAKMGVNLELNNKYERLCKELEDEADVDAKLSELRVQLVNVYQLESAIRARLSELKYAPEAVSQEYQLALELFLDSSDLDDFILPLQNEFDDKVEELKAVAEYQANIIAQLKKALKAAQPQGAQNPYDINYDLVMAKLEKSLADKKQILARLELKLESLQMVKYQLTKDVQKQDQLAIEKDEELQQIYQNRADDIATMQSIFSQKQESLNKMERQLDAVPLTGESQAYADELAEKIAAFKLMMNESELFVEMLEFQLETEHGKSAELQTRLADLSDYVMQQSMRVESIDRQDSVKLEEANKELKLEINTMQKELERSVHVSAEVVALQEKISQLDETLDQMRKEYAEKEDKFLSSLL